MAQLMDYARYLAQEIGARPAGTEEEQQAALYITEQFQKEAGFTSTIEEFANGANLEASRAVLALVSVLCVILAIIFPVLNIPAFILAAAAAAVYALEAFDRPLLARLLARGESQNVIAKYQPNFEGEGEGGSPNGRARTRKVVLVAHYDTGRVTPALVERVNATGLSMPLIVMVAMIVAAFFQLLRIFIAPSGGMTLLVLNVLSIIAALVCVLPAVKALLMRQAPYNEGANNNATGTAALIDVARRIARGSVSEADLADNADENLQIHGEAAAREAGLIPEGAQIRYEAEQLVPPPEFGDYDEEERLLAAKAAIAALTGKPVERRVYGTVAGNLVNARTHGEGDTYVNPDDPDAMAQAGSAAAAAGQAQAAGLVMVDSGVQAALSPEVVAEDAGGFENAPSWFVAAQKNARKAQVGSGQPVEVQRSKYTEAIEKAERAIQVESDAAEAARAADAAAAAAADGAAIASEGAVPPLRQTPDLPLPIGPADNLETGADTRPQAQGTAEPQLGGGQAGAPVAGDALAQSADPATGLDSAAVQVDASASEPMPAPASPSSTVAMAAPIPAAEIVAEAALLDAQQAAQQGVEQQAQPARSRVLVDADLPEPDEGQGAPSDQPAGTSEANDAAGAAASAQRESVRRRFSGLPSITQEPETAQATEPATTSNPSKSGLLRKLRTNIPSLSGLINPVGEAQGQASQQGQQGQQGQASRSASAAPQAFEASRAARRNAAASVPAVVNAPSVQEPEPVDYDMEVPIDMSRGTSGADAISMEVPRSRSATLLQNLRRNNGDDLQQTPQEWLDVDEDYEARSVGRQRGSWESFRDDQYFDDGEDFDDFGTDDSGRGRKQRRASRWQGGAYSRMQLGHVNMLSGAESDADEMIPAELPEDEVDRSLTGEIEQIYHFRNPLFSTEIWFVAIGSDSEGHDGIRAFLDEHHDELRGSMIIEVESLGAGALSVAKDEGYIRKVVASSRIKRYTRQAVATTGISLDEVSLAGSESIASVAQKAGFQAMHLFGAEDGRPALKGSADDVLENVDELLFEDNANFIFELLKM